MSRQSVLSKSEREFLLYIPVNEDELIRHYTLNELDLSLINQRRGDANRLGFAIQLRYLSPLGWEHINLTGDYLWRNRIKVGTGKFRPLRRSENP
jgi:hypothetical protein